MDQNTDPAGNAIAFDAPAEDTTDNNVVAFPVTPRDLRKKAQKLLAGKAGLTDVEKLERVMEAHKLLGQAVELMKSDIQAKVAEHEANVEAGAQAVAEMHKETDDNN